MDVYQKQVQQQYTVYCDVRYSLSWTDHIGSCIVKYVCTHKPENRNNWTLNNIRGLSIYVVITAVWTVLVNSCNLELQHFKIFNDRVRNWHL